MHQDAFYWLELLGNWQQKYHPISRRTGWTQPDGRHMHVKHDVQLAGDFDTYFLFRMNADAVRARFASQAIRAWPGSRASMPRSFAMNGGSLRHWKARLESRSCKR